VGPIVQVRCTIVDQQKKLGTWIWETTVAPQKVKNGAIVSRSWAEPSETSSAEKTFSDRHGVLTFVHRCAHRQLSLIEKVAAM
jgi:hypothetical protein